jgi:iron(III) transport system permease protein
MVLTQEPLTDRKTRSQDTPDAERPRRRRRTRTSPFRTVTVVLALLFVASVLYPFYKIVSTMLYQNGNFTTKAFSEFFHTDDVGASIVNTLIVVAASSAIAIVIGGTIAWLNERTDARMGAVSDFLPMIPFLFPAIASAIGWVFLLSPHAGYVNAIIRTLLGHVGIHMVTGPFNIYSMYGLIFVYVLHQVPFTFLMISSGLRTMDTQLEEQSWMCGISPRATLRRVVLPAMAPSVFGALLLVVWSGFGMYAVPQTIAAPAHIHIMSVSIVAYLQQDFPPKYGSAVVMSMIMVLLIAVVWIASRRVASRARFASVGGRGSRAPRRSLGFWKWPIRFALIFWAMLGTLLPAIALLLVAMNGYWTVHIRWTHLNFASFRGSVFQDTGTRLAAKDSFTIALIVASVGVVLASMLSVMNRSRSKFMSALDGLIKLPVIISHLVLALGFILAFAGPPFKLVGTTTILLLAYLALFMPQGTIVTDPAAVQVGRELEEASELSGARTFRTYRKVFVPLMASSIAVAWGLLFVRVLGDLEVSALLAGPGNPTIGSQTLSLYETGNFSGVAALTLVLTLATVVVVVLMLGLSNRAGRWNKSRTVNPMLPR